MIKIGINGFGRIGKCIFLQLLDKKNVRVCAINDPNIKISDIEDYLKYDSVHNYNKNFTVEIISDNEFKIHHHVIKIINERDATKIDWGETEYLIDATGLFLTSKLCSNHKVKHVIMSAPCKDDTKTFIYGANHVNYSDEKIVSASSCTTNCLAPLLKLLDDEYGVDECVFTTIHATTSSQFTVDITGQKQRGGRCVFNNIIPYTTGASSSVTAVLPQLKGKIHGTSVRVPVSKCSLLDVNVELKNKEICLNDIKNLIEKNPLYKTVYDVCTKNLVSGDFTTTTTPTILDMNASIEMGKGKFKFMLWYDNEWSYSANLIRFVEHMFKQNNIVKEKYYIDQIEMENKGVVCRLDLNVPRVNEQVTDDFRITSAIPTIQTILSKNPKYIVITSHFGRPKEREEKYSTRFMIPILEKYLGLPVQFLSDGIHENTLSKLENGSGVYLLENLRFHKEETDYEKNDLRENHVIQMYSRMGDVFICDAFGCLHRKHMSIYGPKDFGKPRGYGHLIRKEINAIDILINNQDNHKYILGIVGGNKIADKMPIIDLLRKINNTFVYIGGGLAQQVGESIHNSPEHTNIHAMSEGYGNVDLLQEPVYINLCKYDEKTNYHVYDISKKELNLLKEFIKNMHIIFWNGSLGVIEHEHYKKGSLELVKYLEEECKHKTVIIGGGETASLFSKDENNKNPHIYVSTGGGALLEYLQNKILYGKNLIGLEIYI